MRNISCSIACVLAATALFAGNAAAQGTPGYNPIPWQGFYIGINAGASLQSAGFRNSAGAADADNESPFIAAALNLRSGGNVFADFLGGVQVGHNWQPRSSWVYGVEIDFQGGASIRDKSSTAFGTGFVPANDRADTSVAVTRRLRFLGTARGRIGWLIMPDVLIYATGGFAFGNFRATANVHAAELLGAAFVTPDSVSSTTTSRSVWRPGWTVGAGFEMLLESRWSMKTEYLYYDLGRINLSSTVTGITPGGAVDFTVANTARIRGNGHIVRLGFSYRLN